jgi:hypothetical protein
MSTLRTLKKLILGETWLLPVGIAIVVATAALVVRPLAATAWHRVGGLILLAGVLGVLVISVARGAGRRSSVDPIADGSGAGGRGRRWSAWRSELRERL